MEVWFDNGSPCGGLIWRAGDSFWNSSESGIQCNLCEREIYEFLLGQNTILLVWEGVLGTWECTICVRSCVGGGDVWGTDSHLFAALLYPLCSCLCVSVEAWPLNCCPRPGWVVGCFFLVICFIFYHSFSVALREVALNSSQTQTQEKTYLSGLAFWFLYLPRSNVKLLGCTTINKPESSTDLETPQKCKDFGVEVFPRLI